MSMRKHPGQSRAFRPSAEGLEGRKLLAATVTGMNTAGDVWTLKLSGKGTLQVLKQDDASGNPAPLNSASEIKSITISGTDPTTSRLTATVKKAAGSTGEVFFQELNQQTNRSLRAVGGVAGLGIKSINIPDFYLGVTDPTTSTSTGQPRAQINIPDGINSLRFGGVDTTAFFGTDPTQSVTQDGQNDVFLVSLGLPSRIGTSIVINKSISSDQAGTTSSTGTTNSPTQNTVIFDVAGRLNLFQANEIDGNTTIPPAAASFNAGTIVSSYPDPVNALTGAFGFIRVGGNATNFSAVTNDRIANFYVGGEANNVNLLAANGSRNLYFGKGLDTTTILTHTIQNLFANRGAVNSRVVTDRQIGDIMLGGDATNSTFLSGYVQGLASVAGNVQQNINNLQLSQAATIPTPTAQANGNITAFVSGNVTNSVFAASDQPISQLINSNDQTFGNPQDALLPLGKIEARVQGSIDNSTATPDSPTTAFYAKSVKLTRGPVSPPRVVEPPLAPPGTPQSLPGIPVVYPKNTAKTAKA
ncbi:hypothetical protein P12x_001781 [Tundrisphaera lichenicola]|uniref:hypothetical protein n=1 Tax=Tundrisphaera lichenicola TaxID=2029860 RepID=UPI003EBEF2D7